MANERSFTEKYGDATDLAVIVLELFMQVSTAASHSKRVSLLSRPGIPLEKTFLNFLKATARTIQSYIYLSRFFESAVSTPALLIRRACRTFCDRARLLSLPLAYFFYYTPKVE